MEMRDQLVDRVSFVTPDTDTDLSATKSSIHPLLGGVLSVICVVKELKTHLDKASESIRAIPVFPSTVALNAEACGCVQITSLFFPRGKGSIAVRRLEVV